MSDSKKVMEQLLNNVNQTLENEDKEWRPYDANGKTGGLILLKEDLPTIVVPDLHGRNEFLPDLMRFEYRGERVYELLNNRKIQIVCVGDGMHSERRGLSRWRLALQEYQNGFAECPAMAEEMTENFQTMAMVMKLKVKFPDLFHFLKGNHENIMDEQTNGNHPFAKLAAEGPMTRAYVEKFYGTDFLNEFNRFEKNLPLMVRGRFFIVSHARPKRHYTADEVINYRTNPELIEGLTWTRHANAQAGVIPIMLSEMLGNSLEQKIWFIGHTAIKDLYNYMIQESLIEIHNPSLRPIVLIDPNEYFDPDEHIQVLPKSQPSE